MAYCYTSPSIPCPSYPNSQCVIYSGSNLTCTSIKTNDRLNTILEKIDEAICNLQGGGGTGGGFVEAGFGIGVDGVGTLHNPYIISNTMVANSGLTMNSPIIRLGQTVGRAGNPGALLLNTEIPLGDFTLALNNKSGVGADNTSEITFFTSNSLGYSLSDIHVRADFLSRMTFEATGATSSIETQYLGPSASLRGTSGYDCSSNFYTVFDMVGVTNYSTLSIGGTESQVWNVSGDTLIGLFGSKNTGFGGVTVPTEPVHLPSSTSVKASMVFDDGVDPSGSYREGQVWKTNYHLYARLNGQNKQLDNDYNLTPGEFIQNQFLSAQSSANYWIDGHGRIDDYLQISTAGLFKQNGSLLALNSTSDSNYGADLSVRRLYFQASAVANDWTTGYIRYGSGGANFIDIVSPYVNIVGNSLGFDQDVVSPTVPAITTGGQFPLKFIAGADNGNTGETAIIDLYKYNTTYVFDDKIYKNRINFSQNNDALVKKSFGRLGSEVADFGASTYKGDLVFETVDATVNSGSPTEYMRLKYDGRLFVNSLDTDLTAPSTTGATKIVICDSTGLLSFTDASAIQNQPYISSLLGAIATNTIDNANYKQTLSWDSLAANNTGLKLSTASSVTGSSNQELKLLELSISGNTAGVATGKKSYGIYSDVSRTHSGFGSTSRNCGIYSSASGATVNYAGYFVVPASTNTGSIALYGENSGGGIAAQFIGYGTSGFPTLQVNAVDNTADTIAAYIISSGTSTHTNVALKVYAANGSANTALMVESGYSAFMVPSNIPTALVHVGAGDANKASFRLQSSSVDPSSPNEGDVWVRNSHIFCRLNGVTQQLDQQGGGGGGGTVTSVGITSTDLSVGGSPITAAGNIALDINNSAVTYAKIQDVSAGTRLLGRYSASSGVVQEITLGSGLTLDSGTGVLDSISGGSGTVTDFSSGNLSPLFTTSVATSTTTPALTYSLSNAGAHTWFGNNSGSTGAPAYQSNAALTKVDDTNVTLTLGGAPTTSLLEAVSLTLGWTGTLAVGRGGTGISSFTSGDIIIANGATSLTKVALGTAGQLIRVNGSGTSLEYFTPSYVTTAITSLNTLTAATQLFAVGTSGTDFNISSVTDTHTFNIPSASTTARGLITSSSQTLGGYKTFAVAASFNSTQANSDFVVASTGSTNALFVDASADRVGIFTNTPSYPLDIIGNTRISSGNLGIGTAPTASAPLTIGGSGYTGNGIALLPSISSTANSSPSIIGVTGTIIEASSGTHPIIAGVNISAPTITNGAAAVTNAASLYISGATSATVTGGNYSILVNGGTSRFNGDTVIGTGTAYSSGGYDVIVRNQTSGRLETVDPDLVGINSQTGTSYTLVLTDKSKMVTMNNSSANTLTVPPNSSVAFSIGTQIPLASIGTGQTTISPGVGVTIISADNAYKLRVQGSEAALTKILSDVWLLGGDLSV